MSLYEDGRHRPLKSTELAQWLEGQPDRWWTVDGDPLLTGRISFPCPGDELAAELRKINKPLLVSAKESMTQMPEEITADNLDDFVEKAPYKLGDVTEPEVKYYRWLPLCWRGSEIDWELVEDLEGSEDSKSDLLRHRESR
jgi:hypothetical protein